ncbi:hypothetical protein QTP86_012428 [Hemibagrus guttatus]|nr:hypothetical protein QTP86_012428 [Hemibagrus guttatus]
MSLCIRTGFYRQEINKTVWDVPERYRDLIQVGTGAYGTVCCAIDRKTGIRVAIKKLHRPFQSRLFAKRAYRELRLVKHMKHENDLKPGNLAVNQNCELKILDFGLARQADSEMTGYVVTRWYRAPEVILNWMHYTQTVDIWSVGCIMAEMLLGRPLFKGNDHLDQLREIMKITGTPAQDFIVKLQSQDAKNYIRSLPKVPKKDLHSIFFKASSDVVSVMDKMLVLDPDKRVSASMALELPMFADFREPEEETEALPYDHSMDNADLPLEQWKRGHNIIAYWSHGVDMAEKDSANPQLNVNEP